jgi:hypothetical protein
LEIKEHHAALIRQMVAIRNRHLPLVGMGRTASLMHRIRRQLFAERRRPGWAKHETADHHSLLGGRNDDRDVRGDRLRGDGAVQSPCGRAEGEELRATISSTASSSHG